MSPHSTFTNRWFGLCLKQRSLLQLVEYIDHISHGHTCHFRTHACCQNWRTLIIFWMQRRKSWYLRKCCAMVTAQEQETLGLCPLSLGRETDAGIKKVQEVNNKYMSPTPGSRYSSSQLLCDSRQSVHTSLTRRTAAVTLGWTSLKWSFLGNI